MQSYKPVDPGDFAPKYLKVKWAILEDIREGRLAVGDRIPSLNQLVSAFGVSGNTCKKAISALMQDGVLEGQQGRGVYVRSAAARSEVAQISVVTWSDESLARHPVFVLTTQGMMSRVSESDYQLNFCFVNPQTIQLDEMQTRLQQVHAAGIIVTHAPFGVQDALMPLRAKGVPIVSVGRSMDRLTPHAVLNDMVGSLERVVTAALRHDDRPIALIGCPQDEVFNRWRAPALHAAFAAAGRPLSDLIIMRGPATYQTGRSLVGPMIGGAASPGLIIADDDYVAYGAYDELLARGVRVPQDVQLLGIGGFLDPELSFAKVTSLAMPHFASGEQAASLLIDMIDGQGPRRPVVTLPCSLQVRSTLAKELVAMLDPPVPPTQRRDRLAPTGN